MQEPVNIREGLGLPEIVAGRRSVRAFQPREVPPELVRQVLEAARWAPSPHGRQPWRFALLASAGARQRLADAMGDEWRRQLALDGQDAATVELRLQKSRERITGAPVVIVPCLYLGDLDRYPDDERQTAETTMAVQSLGCAVQNMLLTAY